MFLISVWILSTLDIRNLISSILLIYA
jgi:hypothetical protein